MHPIQGETYLFMPDSDRLKALKGIHQFNREAMRHHKRRWVEKTPSHVRAIARIFGEIPDAKVIVMLRDGRDVACSLKERTGSFELGLDRWIENNEAALPFFGHPQIKTVKYEEFVQDPESMTRDVLSWVGEEYESDLFSKISWLPEQDMTEHVLRRTEQLKKPIYDGSGRWKKEMTEEEHALFASRGAGLLKRLGYHDQEEPARIASTELLAR